VTATLTATKTLTPTIGPLLPYTATPKK